MEVLGIESAVGWTVGQTFDSRPARTARHSCRAWLEGGCETLIWNLAMLNLWLKNSRGRYVDLHRKVVRPTPSLIWRVANGLSTVSSLRAVPLVVTCRIAAIVIGTDRAFQLGSHFVALFPGVVGNISDWLLCAHVAPLFPRVRGFVWRDLFDALTVKSGAMFISRGACRSYPTR